MTHAVHTELVDHAVACAPLEACGLLGGTSASVTRFVPVLNSTASPTRFALDGAELLAAESTIERAGLEVVGVMHSHPSSPAWPSDTDLRDAAAYDPSGLFVHVIVSLASASPDVQAFRIVDAQRVRLDMHTE